MTEHFDLIDAERFRDFVTRGFGLAFDDSKLGLLAEVLHRRARARDTTAALYLADIENGLTADEAGMLAEELTVGETYFFRNKDHFRAFTDFVVPARMKRRTAVQKLNVLSAGCSSGEEAFSLVISLSEACAPPWSSSVRAVDLNPAALRRAAGGRFSGWSLRDTPPAIREKWFTLHGREHVLHEHVRETVRFSRANLTEEDPDLWPDNTYDVVFCRNVIMYFAPAVARAVVARIERSLAPGGFLFLGHAETLRGLSSAFDLVQAHGTFFYQRKRGAESVQARDAFDVAGSLTSLDWRSPPAVPALIDSGWFEAIGKASKRIEALAARTPATVSPAAAPGRDLAASLDLLRRERFGDALTLVHEMPHEAQADPDVMLLHAVLLVHGGKLTPAAEICRHLLARDELDAGANYVLGLCHEGSGERRAAAHYYRVAACLAEDFAMPRLHLGLLARRAGNLDEARRELESALELLAREDAPRLLLFGGGFTRCALSELCESELRSCRAAA